MNSTSRIIRINCVLSVLVLLVSVFPAAGAEEDALTIGVKSVKTTYLNPLTPVEREMLAITDLIYEPLIELNDYLEPEGCLVREWEKSDDGKKWIFTLRDGITFHDGSPLTAQDVVATINQILLLAQSGEGQYQGLKYLVSKASVNDRQHFVIDAARPCYGLLYSLTFPVLKADQVNLTQPLGTGPYYVTQYNPGQELLLTAYDDYWNGRAGYREMNIMFYDTNRSLLSAYEYKQVDAIITRSATAAQYRGGSSSLNVTYRTQQLEVLMMNHQEFPLEDPEIRQAIRYAIDIDTIAANVYTDMVVRTDTPLIPNTWTYKDNDLYTYDPEKAKEILAAKGWNDTDGDGVLDMLRDGAKRNLKLRIYVYEEQENSVRIQAANMIADYLKVLGINATVTTMTYSEAKTKLEKRSYDLCLCAFQMDTVPDPGFLLMIGNVCNYMAYRSKEMDSLFSRLRKATDQGSYQQALFEIQDLFAKDCPFICLYYRTGAVLTRTLFFTVRDVREPDVLRGIENALPR